MLSTTYDAIKAILKSDASILVNERNQILFLLRNGAAVRHAEIEAAIPRILRRAEVAKRLGCSLRTVDKLVKQGHLAKRTMPGRVRSHGVLESDLNTMIGAAVGE